MAWKKVEHITEYQMQNRFDSAFNAISGVLTEDEFLAWYKTLEPLLDNPVRAMRAAEAKAAEVVSWWLKPKEEPDSSNSKEQKKKTRGINKPERAQDAVVARQGKPKGSE